ncbi:SDR family oxidoreductase [Brachybacterium sp. J144]|uniref:SDR family NAD(P)-dependent oxidoreductase n=1 Tax=Brachybacterium sp. J144 TaxID=3116487 RepID=UPI002E7641FE|nr:SDR family oxidoreductase [Brachybacterium sp. J144]MEE1650285.1 SDR family oxidoreductase [Brachybacterium sp. J144]
MSPAHAPGERSVAEEARISEVTAVVTGASSPRGIGRGVALRLAREGRPLALLDLDEAGLEQAAAAARDAGAPQVLTRRTDIADWESVDAAFAAVEAELPAVGALVGCAGIADPTPFLESTSQTFARTLAINTTGTYHLARRAVPGMLAQGLGRLVAISSTAAQDGGGNFSTSAYAASKAGVEGLLRGLAKELAGTGVTTAAIAPANIDTDIMGGALEGERRAQFVARTPVGRLGTVEELAELVAWLVGPHGGFTTGATYNLNGGMRVG